MIKRGVLFTLFLIVLSSFGMAAQTVTLQAFDNPEDAVGFIFSKESFTDGAEGDIYVKRDITGESTALYFFAYNNTIRQIGREDVNEFSCGIFTEPDYELETEVLEKQGFCILSYDRNVTMKIYVSNIASDDSKLTIKWGNDIPIESEEEIGQGEEIIETPLNEKESGSEEGGASDITIIDNSQEQAASEDSQPKEKTPSDEKKDNMIEKFSKAVKDFFNNVRNDPVKLFTFVGVVIYAIAFITLAIIRQIKGEKKS